MAGVVSLLVILGTAGCGGSPPSPDGGRDVTAGPADAAGDAADGGMDAAAMDSGPRDGAPGDRGAFPWDALTSCITDMGWTNCPESTPFCCECYDGRIEGPIIAWCYPAGLFRRMEPGACRGGGPCALSCPSEYPSSLGRLCEELDAAPSLCGCVPDCSILQCWETPPPGTEADCGGDAGPVEGVWVDWRRCPPDRPHCCWSGTGFACVDHRLYQGLCSSPPDGGT